MLRANCPWSPIFGILVIRIYMRHIFFAFSWIFLSAGVILVSVAGMQFYLDGVTWSDFTHDPGNAVRVSIANLNGKSAKSELSTQMQINDARSQLVANFLERYNSPLKPYDYFGKTLVEIADEYNIDFRLLPAIAMQESNLCKVTPPGSYNCLGLGVHARGTWGFESYEENFRAAARVLKQNYIDQGLVTPEQIMRKYTPSSNGSWAASVNQWMAEMRFDDRSLGKSEKDDAYLLEFVK
ncbi:MAG: hypothetical protein COY80_01220 [Candidatus Pacebacteria bacterium CG_4_10_14_0_8_um_filter_42_14]|nr:MAG: hypothetical protein COY80_01220 [Candidatus Pacebacteria bacterium CG_4_10_14_0_8_um_filter_42_14]